MSRFKKRVLVGIGVGFLAGFAAFIYYRYRQFVEVDKMDDYDDYEDDEDFDDEISDEFDESNESRYTELHTKHVDSDDASMYVDRGDFDGCESIDKDTSYSGTAFKQVTGVSREEACKQIADASMGTLTVNELRVLHNDDLAEKYASIKVD